MLRFFRRIRQRLLTDNKFSKYLLYAIGEILLVVVGILIALQVDSWNAERKDAIKLRTALQSVYKDIVQDSLLIDRTLPGYLQIEDLNQELLQKAYASSTTLDTLKFIMKEEFPIYWITSLPFNHNTFDNLKATGAFEILPEDIKLLLSDYYTTVEDNKKLTDLHTDQYRRHLDEFVSSYNIIGRIHDPNYKDSYLFNATWNNIDPAHFLPKVAVVLGAYDVMYSREIRRLQELQERIREILPKLEPYLSP